MHEIEMHNQTCGIDSKVSRDVSKGGRVTQSKILFLILNWLLMVLQCKWQFCLLGSNASTHPNQPNFTEIAYWHVKCAVDDNNYSFAVAHKLTDKNYGLWMQIFAIFCGVIVSKWMLLFFRKTEVCSTVTHNDKNEAAMIHIRASWRVEHSSWHSTRASIFFNAFFRDGFQSINKNESQCCCVFCASNSIIKLHTLDQDQEERKKLKIPSSKERVYSHSRISQMKSEYNIICINTMRNGLQLAEGKKCEELRWRVRRRAKKHEYGWNCARKI